MKKIIFFCDALDRGGAERVISILANHYAALGWQVSIVLLLSDECNYILDPSIEVVPMCFETSRGNRIVNIPKWIKYIRSFVKNKKPDILVSFLAGINITTLVATFGLGIPIIISERNDPQNDGRGVMKQLLCKLVYPLADAIIFQTRSAQRFFSNSVIKKSYILLNPVTVEAEYKGFENKIIVTAGRLEKQKNHSLLIDAFSDISKTYPEYKLIIYGEGSLRNELQNKIDALNLSESILLPGNISHIHEMIANSEIFVLSSDFEGMSNALMEALMIGTPSISTECNGSTDLIINGENGWLVPVGDKNALQEKIELMISSRALRENISLNSKKMASKYNTENVLKQWRNVVEDTIAN